MDCKKKTSEETKKIHTQESKARRKTKRVSFCKIRTERLYPKDENKRKVRKSESKCKKRKKEKPPKVRFNNIRIERIYESNTVTTEKEIKNLQMNYQRNLQTQIII